MKIFSILKVDDKYILMQDASVRKRVDPSADSPNRSGVTTALIDEVSVVLKETHIF
jgi:hypothetical protein